MLYNRKMIDGKVSFQPNRIYKVKIIICLILAVAAFVTLLLWKLPSGVSRLIICLGAICTFYAVYDFLFKLNLTFIFNQLTREVYQQVPGLYSRKLMSFEEVYFLQEITNGDLCYTISNKKNRFGKNYIISDYFPDTKKGRKRQEQFETEILEILEDMIVTAKAPNI
ncbi:hypothetical protein [Chitinophaga sp. OAE865]|uniref:hypothetical protein n=1 Tax=Chitinophaga sp. OAE865 TaxID=2817898 RepID=UPI001AE4A4AB